jgi:hypothetical protein
MQQNYADSLLRSGIIEARAGARASARRYLERAIYASDNSQHDTMAEAWFWMAEVTDDPLDKRKALENALSHDLSHARARRALAILDGRIKAGDLIDPDNIPAASTGLVQADSQRFMCPKCGGRISFAPDGQSLVCDYCTRHETLDARPVRSGEEDFLVAMHTLRGHSQPLSQKVFHCQGCGAEFILPPTHISESCMYCGSPHVLSPDASSELIAPNSLIPHGFDQNLAAAHLSDWIEKHELPPGCLQSPPRGLYLPAWIFDIGGSIAYTGQLIQQEKMFGEGSPAIRQVRDEFAVHLGGVVVPASRKLAKPLSQLLATFDLGSLHEYDPRYLADWAAEVYDISVGDASLDARSQAYQRLKPQLQASLDSIHLISTSSAGMTVESFRLVLLPVWLGVIRYKGNDETLLVNGQNGSVGGLTFEKKGLFDWLADILEG